MVEHFPAYIDTTAYACFDTLLTREHFIGQMQQNREDLTGEFGSMFPELIQMDPMGMRGVLAVQLKPLMSAGSYQTIDGHFFVPDTTVCVAFITPRYSGTNTGQGSAMFRMTHPQVRISYYGTPASGFYNSSQIKNDLTTTIAGAVLLVLVFLMLCFRRWDTVPLLLLPVVFGTLFGMAMMYWIRGEFSLMALGIGGVVLGVAMSYVLHVMTHHQYVGDTEQLLRPGEARTDGLHHNYRFLCRTDVCEDGPAARLRTFCRVCHTRHDALLAGLSAPHAEQKNLLGGLQVVRQDKRLFFRP